MNEEELFRLLSQAHADYLTGTYSNSDHGKTLPEVMDNIRHAGSEISAYFDQCGNKLCEHTSGNKHQDIVAVPDQLAAQISLTVHNHLHNLTFSAVDLKTTASYDFDVMMVVTPDYNYLMMRPSTGWPQSDDWIDEYATIVQVLLNRRLTGYSRTEAQHLALEKVAKHHGIIYRAAKIA